jgi:hypothetical protein
MRSEPSTSIILGVGMIEEGGARADAEIILMDGELLIFA